MGNPYGLDFKRLMRNNFDRKVNYLWIFLQKILSYATLNCGPILSNACHNQCRSRHCDKNSSPQTRLTMVGSLGPSIVRTADTNRWFVEVREADWRGWPPLPRIGSSTTISFWTQSEAHLRARYLWNKRLWPQGAGASDGLPTGLVAEREKRTPWWIPKTGCKREHRWVQGVGQGEQDKDWSWLIVATEPAKAKEAAEMKHT